jgi:hypothetical protein
MEQQPSSTGEKDQKLWAIAKRRARFKKDMVMYVAVNVFLWVIWLLTDGHLDRGIPWPVWPTVGWGLAMVFDYYEAFRNPKENAVEREYEKLKNQQNK